MQFYGKPHAPIYRSLEVALDLPPERLLMIGDSLEHDIAGAAQAGWRAVFIRGGLHSAAFTGADVQAEVAALAAKDAAPMPDFTLWEL